MIEEIKNTGSECKIEKDSKLQTHFKVENSFLPHEFLKNNYYYTFGYPSNNNHYDYTNLYRILYSINTHIQVCYMINWWKPGVHFSVHSMDLIKRKLNLINIK